MAPGAPAYKVDDRSLLLPFYRRFLVDPLLPFLPASLHPNTITHAGHLLNLMGTATLILLWPRGGWPFAFAALLLQLYLWCDNADGAHARRTKQCSALGEFLDHGLDQLNTAYIALLTAMALGAPPLWWVIIALIIPGAAVVTYWEQAQTGVFRLGLLNQVESVFVLTCTLLASAAFGTQLFEKITLFGVTLRLAMLLWVASTILFGMMRGVGRVATKDGFRAVLPVVGPIAFGVAISAAAALGAVSTVAAVTIAIACNVYLGMRMLSARLLGRLPRVEPPIVAGVALLGGLCVWRLLGQTVSPVVGQALATLSCAVFGAQAILDARESVLDLSRGAEPGEPALK